MGGNKIRIKMLVFFVIVLLITFGLGYSLQSFFDEELISTVKANSDISFGKAPLNVSFSFDLFSFDGVIKKCLWDFNDGTKTNEIKTNHTFHREGIFNVSLILWDEAGKKMKDNIEINVIEYYEPLVLISANNTFGKVPLSVQFIAEPFDVDGNEFTYNWDFDDKSFSKERNPTHTFQETGLYKVRLIITDADGLENYDSIQINVLKNHPPTAYANASKLEGGPPLTVEFEADHVDVDGGKVTYHWYFENTLFKGNRESNEQNPTHTFYFPGTYLVKLTVKDEEGAIDTDVVQIKVTENWFSGTMDRIFDFSLQRIIKRSLPDFIAEFILKLMGGLFWKTFA